MAPCCYAPDKRKGGPRIGGSATFVDPADPAPIAPVFWQSESYSRIAAAYIHDADQQGPGRVVSLSEIPARRWLLKTAKGEQCLLIAAGSTIIQLRCIGADIRLDPFRLALVFDRFPDIESEARLLKRLSDIARGRQVKPDHGQWTVEATRHRDALAALDLRAAGRSYREIAVFLHGGRVVERDWALPDQTLKNRTIRSVKRGRRLRDGGYRALLQ